MANDRKQPPVHKEQAKKNVATQVLFFPLKLMGSMVGGIIIAIPLSIVIEWVGLTFIWTDNPNHAYEMFQSELQGLGSNFRHGIAGFNPFQIVSESIHYCYEWLFNSSLVVGIKAWLPTHTKSSFLLFIKELILWGYHYIEGAAYVILTIIMRVIIFILSAPWFLLCALTGLVHGLVEREIRKSEGGIEHAYVHHATRRHINWVIFITWLVYLSIPVATHPSLVIIPGGILFGYFIYVAAWSFKKFL